MKNATETTTAAIGADALREALREALWTCVEHNALHFGESHNTVIQGRAALASAAPQPAAPQGDSLDSARLDWLIEQGNCVVRRGINGFWVYWIGDFDNKRSRIQNQAFPTARAAIDAARAKEGASNAN